MAHLVHLAIWSLWQNAVLAIHDKVGAISSLPSDVAGAFEEGEKEIDKLRGIEDERHVDYRGKRRAALDRISSIADYILKNFPNPALLSQATFRYETYLPMEHPKRGFMGIGADGAMQRIKAICRYETDDDVFFWGRGLIDFEDDLGQTHYYHKIYQLLDLLEYAANDSPSPDDPERPSRVLTRVADLEVLEMSLREAVAAHEDDTAILINLALDADALANDSTINYVRAPYFERVKTPEFASLLAEPTVGKVLQILSSIARTELSRREEDSEKLEAAGEYAKSEGTGDTLIRQLEARSPVIAAVRQEKIDVINGPENAKPRVVDPAELRDLLQAVRHLVEYLSADLSHRNCNLNPNVSKEVARFGKVISADNPIWYVIEDSVTGLEHYLGEYADEPWPAASKRHLESLIVRTRQLKPLLKPEPILEISAPELRGQAISYESIDRTISELEYFVASTEVQTALTDSAMDFVSDTANELKQAQILGADANKKKSIIFAISGFAWSAYKVAGTAAKHMDDFAKAVPILKHLWEFFSKFF